jgi:hypothetical protein
VVETRRKSVTRPRQAQRPVRVDVGAQTIEIHRRNSIILGAGIGCIVLGFIALSMHDITLSPILLVAGYLVLIPWGLIAREKGPEETRRDDETTP